MENEIARRKADGYSPTTIRAIESRLKALGYRLDRDFDCRSICRIMTGPNAGETYPVVTTGIREIDTGLSFANCDARRDENFKALQALRLSGELFAVTRGAIFEI